MEVSAASIDQLATRLGSALRRTPIIRSILFERHVKSKFPIYFKLENLQHTGSFKSRGALAKLLEIEAEAKSKGVIAASAGNHAQGVAFHSERLGISCKVVMPLQTPSIKINSTRQWGAEILLFGESYQEAYTKALELQKTEGRVLIHAFDDAAIICGQGSLAKEVVEDVPDLKVFLCPIGGGGLMAGCATYLKEKNPKIRIEAVQAEGASSFLPSLEAGSPITLNSVNTIAEGISAKRMGDITFPLCKKYVDACVTVSDEEIAAALLWLLENERLFVEGCAGAAIAAVIKNPAMITGPTVVVLSGGNLDVNFLARLIERGLKKTGRLMRLDVTLTDVPGALLQLIQVFAEASASIVNVAHERVFAHTGIREVFVEITLETQGTAHITKIAEALNAKRYTFQVLD